VIARLNVGGPAHHATLLTNRLDPACFETLLLFGAVGPREEELPFALRGESARGIRLPALSPEVAPVRDVRAFGGALRAAQAFQPDIVHTHTAKAGFVGRAAALCLRARPAIVHTYHGHVLESYFGPLRSGLYREAERRLASITNRLIAVSEQTRDDLVRLHVAPAAKFSVVPIGLDLTSFAACGKDERSRSRRILGVGDDEVVVGFWGRLVPIKRVDVLLRAVAHAHRAIPTIRLIVAGDGEERLRLENLASELGIAGRVSFLGFRTDVADLAAATDIAALSSDNEGTPVSLIESGAAALPCVATDVGGVDEIVTPQTGLLVPAGHHEAFAEALVQLASDPEARQRMGQAARGHVITRYGIDRLVADIEKLYRELLRHPRPGSDTAGRA
jgi:glycosyltransferase involved in cell wall biosynthesis